MMINSRVCAPLTAALSIILIASFSPLPYAAAAPSSTVEEASARMGELSSELETAGAELAQIQVQVDETKAAVAEHQERIHELKDDLSAAQDDLAAVVKDSYINGSDSYLSVILGAESFSDFTSRLYYVEQVAAAHAETIDYVIGLSNDIDSETERLNSQLAEQEQLLADAQSRTSSIESALSEQQQIVDSLTAEELAQVNARNEAGHATSGDNDTGNASGAAGAAANGGSASNGNGGNGTNGNNGNNGNGGSGRTNPAPAPTPQPSASNLPAAKSGAADVAYGCLGIPYVWGGTTRNGFDCSGLCQFCFRQIGVSIPRDSYSQYAGTSRHPSRNQLEPGDLVFFNGFGHVGIYVGGGSYIHAPQTGDVVKVSSLSARGDYCGAARY